MKNIYILILILLTTNVQAQVDITGKIWDIHEDVELYGATIMLAQKGNPKIQYFGVSGEKGDFNLTKVIAGEYQLEISYLGKILWFKSIQIKQKNIRLGTIKVTVDPSILTEVQVTSTAIAIQIKEDTLQYNAKSYKSNPDATAENLLEKMPGMSTENGKTQAQGETVKQVLVDGRPFFGDDPQAALKNIPAEIIDKIQVFDQQSEQAQFTGFDDGNSIKTINIITKAKFRNGTFGQVYAGYGYEDKHAVGGVINRFAGDKRLTILAQSNDINRQNFSSEDLAGILSSSNKSGRGGRRRRKGGGKGGSSGSDVNDFLVAAQGGITETNAVGVNYSDKWGQKVDISGSYFLNQTDNVTQTSAFQRFFSSSDDAQVYAEQENAQSKNINHRLNLKLKYAPSRTNTIVFVPKFTLQTNTGFSDLTGETKFGSVPLNQTVDHFQSDVSAWKISNLFVWRHRFEKRRRTFSLNLNQKITSNKAESFQDAQSNYCSTMSADTINYNSDLDEYEQTYSARFVYTEPIGKRVMLQLNYMPSISLSSGEKETFDYNYLGGSYSDFNKILSNSMTSQYLKNKLGTGFRINTKKSKLMVNLAFQYAELSADQTLPVKFVTNKYFSSVLPSLMWRFSLSQKKKLIVFYRTRTTAPTITELQEVLDNTNPVQLRIGNRNLGQAYSHNVYLKYSATNPINNSVFFAMLNGSFVDNYIGTKTIHARTEKTFPFGVLPAGSQLIRPVNMDGYFKLKSFVTYGRPLARIKSNLHFNLSASWAHEPSIINGKKLVVNAPSFGMGMVMSSNISKKLDFTISSTSSMNYSESSFKSSSNTKYFNQSTKLRFYWNFWKVLTYRTNLQHQYYSGFSNDYDTNYMLWEMSLGAKIFKNQKGELALSVYDILGQNKNLTRETTEIFVQDTETLALQTYGLLTFRYRM